MNRIVSPKTFAPDLCHGIKPHRSNVLAADAAVNVGPGGWAGIPAIIAGAEARAFGGARYWELRLAGSTDDETQATLVEVYLWPEDGHSDDGLTLQQGAGLLVLSTTVNTSGRTVANKNPFTGAVVAATTFYEADTEDTTPTYTNPDRVTREVLLGSHLVFNIDLRGMAYGFVRIAGVASGARVEVGDRIY
jgi:hypothetical protein